MTPVVVEAVISSGSRNTRVRLSSGAEMTFPSDDCPGVGDVLPFCDSTPYLSDRPVRPLRPSDNLSDMLAALDDFVYG